jgi:hypothetical protein
MIGETRTVERTTSWDNRVSSESEVMKLPAVPSTEHDLGVESLGPQYAFLEPKEVDPDD